MFSLFHEPYIFPNFSPILIQLGPFSIHYYALAYLGGAFLGVGNAVLFTKMQPKPLTKEQIWQSFNWILLSIIIGGRIGYVIFYDLGYYLGKPWEIVYIWQGGMSFHGGFIGFIIGMWFYNRSQNMNFLSFMDMAAMVAPIGLFFGRISNFINGELWGRPTNGEWGIVFSHIDNLPRHPSQLYEAFLEGICIYLILWLLAKYSKILFYRGMQACLFVILYGIMRFVVEFFREPDAHIGLLYQGFSRGQYLSLIQILLGVALFLFLRNYTQNLKKS